MEKELLSLTEDECKSFIWEHMFRNKFLKEDQIFITEKNKECDQDLNADDTLDEEYFSDDEEVAVLSTSGLGMRKYQHELASNALQGYNTIICAPTGSGKTRVATHIILEHLKSNSNNKKKVVFLCKTVPLTNQQYKTLLKHLPPEHKITVITGQHKDSQNVKMLLKYNSVLVMTPMILMNNLTRNGLCLNKISLMIIDECHHTRKADPYNLLMFSYIKAKYSKVKYSKSVLPQVVGLTASVGIEKAKELDEAINNIIELMANLDAPYMSIVKKHQDELTSVVPIPKESSLALVQLEGNQCQEKFFEIMIKFETILQQCGKELKSKELNALLYKITPDKKSQKYGQWAVNVKKTVHSIPADESDRSNILALMTSTIISDYLAAFNFALETLALVEAKDTIAYLKKCLEHHLNKINKTFEEKMFYDYFKELQLFVEKTSEEINPNLKILEQTLLTKLVRPESRCIIFVKTRALAVSLTSWFNRCQIERLKLLNASFFTGINAAKDLGGMNEKDQEETIQCFKNGIVKLLVATSVAEEGLDIPECDLVIKYNHIGNEITTVQTRGRSRKCGGASVLLGMKDVLKREKDNQDKAILMDQAVNIVSNMNIQDIQNRISLQQKENIKEYESMKLKSAQSLQYSSFRIVCSHCRQVGIESFNLRTIYEKYRISLDRDLLDARYTRCKPSDQQSIDGLDFVGDVICCGPISPGATCDQKLGIIVKYSGIPFFAVSKDKIVLIVGNILQSIKKWNKAPPIAELTTDDIKRYIMVDDVDIEDQLEEDESSSEDD